MFSSRQRSKRKRGVILSLAGWQRLEAAKKIAETRNNRGRSYTLEDLNELTGLSSHTITKVRRRQKPVDRQSLEDYFDAFNLRLQASDYVKPLALTDNESEKTEFISQEYVATKLALSKQLEPSLPEGQVSLGSPFYVMRSPVETDSYKAILQPGSLIRIKAPRRMGKTSLMVRILNNAAQENCQTVFLSLQMASRDILQSLDKFLQWFSASVGLGMHVPNRINDYWDDLFGCKISCKMYFEQHLLTKVDRPLVLALDDVDRLFDYPEVADEFFGLLRTWHEQGKNRSIWQQLRLIVAHSTEVYIPLNTNKSPFNVGLPIELNYLSAKQIKELSLQYSLQLSAQEANRLLDITCGQPYLTQLGLYSLWQDKISLAELSQQATKGTGIYASHLQRLLWTLEQNTELASSFNRVLQAEDFVEIELLPGFKLESLGLVELQGNQAKSACSLYTKYFRDRLSNY